MANRGGGQIDQIGKGRTRADEWKCLTEHVATEKEPMPEVPICPEHKAKYTTKLEQSAGASRDKAVRDNARALLKMRKTEHETAMKRPGATAEPVEPTRSEDDSEAAWGAIKEEHPQQKAQHEAEMKANKAKIADRSLRSCRQALRGVLRGSCRKRHGPTPHRGDARRKRHAHVRCSAGSPTSKNGRG